MLELLTPESQQGNSYERISPTAKVIAQLRVSTDIPFAEDFAKESGSREVFNEFFGDIGELVIKFTPLIEARYKATDRILNERGINQVLEIASGLSPRGMAMTENPEVIYVATDLPKILKQGQSIVTNILSRTNSSRHNLHYKVVNALDKENLSAATVFFKPSDSIAVISEGLFTYLNRKEKSVVATNILELLRKSGGVWITSDTTTNMLMEKLLRISKKLGETATHVTEIIEHDIKKGTFTDEADVRKFFCETGFIVEEYHHSNLIDELSSIKTVNIDQEFVMEMLHGRKTLILTPQK